MLSEPLPEHKLPITAPLLTRDARTVFSFTPAKKLSLCLVSHIIALALYHRAFDAESLIDAASVLGVRVWGSTVCTTLRWKESMLKIPVFRRIRRGGVVSKNEAMLYATLRDAMARQSTEAGFEIPWTPRFFRRGTANAANGTFDTSRSPR